MNALEKFLINQEEAKSYLSQYGDSPSDLNKAVTLSYNNIANNDPLFVWFSAGAVGSAQVGKVIELGNQPVLKNCQSTQTITQGFSFGNQEIHNNIVPLYHTYKDMGLNGLNELKKIDSSGEYTSQHVIDAFEKYSVIEKKAISYATENNLSYNDPKVLKHILSNQDNAITLKDSNIDFIRHEQKVVNPMYDKIYFSDGKTVGEIIKDTCYIEKIIANKLELSGAKILDKYFPTDEYDFSIYEDRIKFFQIVFDEFFNVLKQSDGLEQLNDQRGLLVLDLGVDFIPYGEHFQDESNIDPLQNMASAEPLGSNEAETFDPLGLFGPSPNKIFFDPLGVLKPFKKSAPNSLNIIEQIKQNDIIKTQDILDGIDSIILPQEYHAVDYSYHNNIHNPLNYFELHEVV